MKKKTKKTNTYLRENQNKTLTSFSRSLVRSFFSLSLSFSILSWNVLHSSSSSSYSFFFVRILLFQLLFWHLITNFNSFVRQLALSLSLSKCIQNEKAGFDLLVHMCLCVCVDNCDRTRTRVCINYANFERQRQGEASSTSYVFFFSFVIFLLSIWHS